MLNTPVGCWERRVGVGVGVNTELGSSSPMETVFTLLQSEKS